MAILSKVMLIGSLISDPETQYSKSGRATCKLALNVNRSWKNKEGREIHETTLFYLIAIGKKAES